MVRKFKKEDIDAVMKLWLAANTQVHDFVPKSYWEGNYDMVKQMLPKAEVYVYEDNGKEDKKILGFIGLREDYVAGVFIEDKERSKGIGKQLLDYVKQKNEKLTLHVYGKNERAVRFYQREGFIMKTEQVDEETGEKEFVMIWESGKNFI